jgi:hypothetical protein
MANTGEIIIGILAGIGAITFPSIGVEIHAQLIITMGFGIIIVIMFN